MSAFFESQQEQPINEALEEAEQLTSEVGGEGTTEAYARAYSALVEEKTKELLENKDWLQTLNFTVEIMDKIQELQNKDRDQKVKANKKEIANLTNMLKASIAVLDEKEEKGGAPAYPNGTETTDEQHQAYLKRIDWRQEQIKNDENGKAPKGKEIGRKWAFYTRINNQYLLLNKRSAFSDVFSISILENRTPGETIALSSEEMSMEKISIRKIIQNGMPQQVTYRTIAFKTRELKEYYKEMSRQLGR